MQLAKFLETNKVSLGEFARRIGVRNARTVQRYTKHGRIPTGRVMLAIMRETAGEVQPNDFFEPAPAEAGGI